MKNKKGDLMDNVLGVVIAVIGLALLVYGAYKIYQTFVNQDSENAKKTIDIIESKINALQDNQTAKFLIQGFHPKNQWVLAAWSPDSLYRPDKCFLNSCICICELTTGFTALSGLDVERDCQSYGFCRKVDSEKAFIYASSKIEVLPYIERTEEGVIKIDPKLMELSVEKKKETNTIIISRTG